MRSAMNLPMESLLSFDSNANLAQKFRTLQKQNTLHCGEWLLSLQSQGFNQTQIALKLKANRHVIGRYLKAAKNKKLKSSSKPVLSPVKNAIKANVSRSDMKKSPDPSLTWVRLLKGLILPQNALLVICVFGLTGYLTQQGIIFFSMVEGEAHSIVANAILSEAVPLITAACFALSTKKVPRFLMGMVLLGSIVGMGLFMHATIQNRMVEKSGLAEQYQVERNALNQSITSLAQMVDTLPTNFVTKRQQVIAQMNQQRQELGELTSKISSAPENIQLASNAIFAYSLWLRVAAMLLNAFLVHMLMRSFLSSRFRLGE